MTASGAREVATRLGVLVTYVPGLDVDSIYLSDHKLLILRDDVSKEDADGYAAWVIDQELGVGA